SAPVENIPYSYYKEFTRDEHHKGKFADYVQTAIPYCLGDSYEEFRVVGTTPQMFEAFEYVPGKKYEFSAGRNFEHDHFFEGVIGSIVANKTGLKLGDEFQPAHGVENDEQGHKHDAFKVVGILKPTGTPNDRALFVNMEGFYLLRGHAKAAQPNAEHTEHGEHADHDHETSEASGGRKPPGDADHDHEHDADQKASGGRKPPGEAEGRGTQNALRGAEDEPHHDEHEHDAKEHGENEHGHDEHPRDEHDHDAHDHDHDVHSHSHEPLPESQREVTAILIRTNPDNILANKTLQRLINKGRDAQAVQPAVEIFSLFDSIVRNLQLLLLLLAILVIAVAGIGIMVSIYNSMSDRRRDIAVMRSLGARRSTVMTIILLESILLSLGGGLGGFLLGHGLIGLASPWIVAQTGVSIGLFEFNLWEACLIPGLIALASAVGFWPAMSAYGTDVAKALSAAP
ncbi:MAG TPA: FtsX-like permease family protein, partial [Pirellulales bacterium]|nr:FtsX-like permease family protein [Pirellulales bacterium]